MQTSAWADMVSERWPIIEVPGSGLKYWRVDPTAATCSDVPCPLLVVLPGAAGHPWLLFQDGCMDCHQVRRTVLMSPLYDTKQEHVLEDVIMPSVSHAIKGFSGVDVDRVYLITTSRSNELGFRAALHFPNVFAMVHTSGQFSWDRATEGLELDKFQEVFSTPQRLRSLQFHVGAKDDNQGASWWTRLATLSSYFPSRSDSHVAVDVRIYLEAEHAVWFAAWNSLHDTLWQGRDLDTSVVRATCSGELEGAALDASRLTAEEAVMLKHD